MIPTEDDPRLYQAQLQLEARAVDLGIQRYTRANTTRLGSARDLADQPLGQLLCRLWVNPLADALEDALTYKRGHKRVLEARKTISELPLTNHEVAFLAIRNLLKLKLDKGGQPEIGFTTYCTTLGRTLLDEVKMREFKESHSHYVKAILENHKLTSKSGSLAQAVARGKERLCGQTALDDRLSNIDAFTIGTEVARILLVVCDEWFVLTKGTSKHKPTRITMTSAMDEWLTKKGDLAALLRPVFQPMIVPPIDWSANGSGGYLSLTNSLVRSTVNSKCTHETAPSQECRRALNIAQRTPWKVNKDVQRVASVLFRNQSGVGGLPTYVDVPQRDEAREEGKPEVARARKKAQLQAIQHNIKMDSEITTTRVKLDIAEDYQNCEAIYFPHSFDWRGRIYPIPTGLQPQGDDLSKSLLHFADAKPLGSEGYQWLAIHVANTFGEDKLTYDDRIKWTEDNEDKIMACAGDPFSFRWWTEADSPFKFLACCFEWDRLVKWDGALRDFPSRLPVALDGTCSGLQHFSALLRDSRGGASVNLVPAAKPQDIYLEVATELKDIVAAQGDCWQSRVWADLINRSTCKRGTMTQPYSVTARGMANQLIDLIKGEDYNLVWARCEHEAAVKRDRMTDEEWSTHDDRPNGAKACHWLSVHLGTAIDRVVIASSTGRGFICAIARAYAQHNLFWRWSTPMGMDIVQGYRKPKEILINTFIGSARVRVRSTLVDDSPTEGREVPKDTSKTRSGASANFIHSLDATHLMMTVSECYDQGGVSAFALVHDSFGVHAGLVPVLTVALRSTFVTMYTSDLLRGLLDQAFEDLPDEAHQLLPEMPEMGTLNLDSVRQSPYLFM